MRKLKLADFDHPVVFLLFNTMAIIAIVGLLAVVFTKFGWPGPAALVGAGGQ